VQAGLLDGLDLTTDQRAQIDEILEGQQGRLEEYWRTERGLSD
jgi:Spy/CpxP family protein refolding chaperone